LLYSKRKVIKAPKVVKSNQTPAKDKFKLNLARLAKTHPPSSPLYSSPQKKKKDLEIFIRPWHDDDGSTVALVVHGSGTFDAKAILNSFGVPGGYYTEESITLVMNKYNLFDFKKEGRFFHSKGPKGSFWIFSALQHIEIDKKINEHDKFTNLLETFKNYFESDKKNDWIFKIAPPMLLEAANTAMWNIYVEISYKIKVPKIKPEVKIESIISTSAVDDNY